MCSTRVRYFHDHEDFHVEDLAAYLSGRERVDAAVRWGELQPAYAELATNVG
jgi:hypothetical protein